MALKRSDQDRPQQQQSDVVMNSDPNDLLLSVDLHNNSNIVNTSSSSPAIISSNSSFHKLIAGQQHSLIQFHSHQHPIRTSGTTSEESDWQFILDGEKKSSTELSTRPTTSLPSSTIKNTSTFNNLINQLIQIGSSIDEVEDVNGNDSTGQLFNAATLTDVTFYDFNDEQSNRKSTVNQRKRRRKRRNRRQDCKPSSSSSGSADRYDECDTFLGDHSRKANKDDDDFLNMSFKGVHRMCTAHPDCAAVV